MIRDDRGRILLVEPTYRPDRLLPGGSVEADESPAAGVAREVQEELGLALPIGRPLAMQWERAQGDSDGVLHFAYDGGVLDPSAASAIMLEAGLASFRFVDRAAVAQLASAGTASLIEAALEALARSSFIEL